MKKFYFALALLFLAISLIVLFRAFLIPSYLDFGTYYYTSLFAFTGRNPYGSSSLFVHSVYPPFAFLLFLPFTFFTIFVAEKIWVGMSFIFFAISILLLFKILKMKVFSVLGILLLTLLLNYFPLKFTLGLGQINNLILLLLVLFLYFFEKKKDLWAGLFLALSFSIKLFPALIIVYLVATKRFKAFYSFLLTSLFVLILTFILIRKDIILTFFNSIVSSIANSWKLDYYNQALSGFLGRQIGNQSLAKELTFFLSAIIITLSFVIIVKKYKQKRSFVDLLPVSIILTANVLVDSFSWQHHFVWLIPSFLITLVVILKSGNQKIWLILLLIFSFGLVGANLKSPQDFPVLIQSHVFFGALLLWLIGLFLVLKTNVESKEYFRKKSYQD